MKNLRIFF